jgi:hypothetical protein
VKVIPAERQPSVGLVVKLREQCLPFSKRTGEAIAIEIAKLSGLKVTSVNQTLFQLKKSGHVRKGKNRGSPYVLAKK